MPLTCTLQMVKMVHFKYFFATVKKLSGTYMSIVHYHILEVLMNLNNGRASLMSGWKTTSPLENLP